MEDRHRKSHGTRDIIEINEDLEDIVKTVEGGLQMRAVCEESTYLLHVVVQVARQADDKSQL